MYRKATALVLAVVLGSSTGCSHLFMAKAPDPVPAPDRVVDCTTSTAAPILDTACSVYFVANTLVVATLPDCNQGGFGKSCLESKNAGLALSAALAGLCMFGVAAGYRNAERCQAVKQQNELCMSGDLVACGSLNPAWRPGAMPTEDWPGTEPALPVPSQREDGFPHGAPCTATWECAAGLTCDVGRCAAP